MAAPVATAAASATQIDAAALSGHVMRPPNVAGATGDLGRQTPGAPRAAPQKPRTAPPQTADVALFQAAIRNALSRSAVGYCMELRQHGAVVATQQHGLSQVAGAGSSDVLWTPNTPMHVASLSKLITAIAMTKVLASLNVQPGSPIAGYLPAYWSKGAQVDKITFADLLTHTSGLTSTATDFESMKSDIAAGVSTIGTYQYANMNFSLCRILLATLNKAVALDAQFPAPFQDAGWDLATINAFQGYVTAFVFNPSGAAAHLAHQPGDALAYSFPALAGQPGWNDGDLTTGSGADGWHMTASQYLDVMGTFRRAGTILSTAQAQAMLDDGFGVDWIGSTAAGAYYAKNGLWENGDGQTEQSTAFFLPDDMEAVVFVNSQVGTTNPPGFLMGIVATAYESCLR
jgi:CubicO group peptidase (beta-lactamase class C family)